MAAPGGCAGSGHSDVPEGAQITSDIESVFDADGDRSRARNWNSFEERAFRER
jgi:hypothetical protein